eukprot:TRINITY_DN3152_c0_g1_i3.p1 TRINITY_DN3152_c0_g1~~TRINITY_DN3152_c0_g1_i3.p1  ORF type:complete len:185 (-),score=-17.79 TRINITY_DN3152_c0_g1_i3:180-734(-)
MFKNKIFSQSKPNILIIITQKPTHTIYGNFLNKKFLKICKYIFKIQKNTLYCHNLMYNRIFVHQQRNFKTRESQKKLLSSTKKQYCTLHAHRQQCRFCTNTIDAHQTCLQNNYYYYYQLSLQICIAVVICSKKSFRIISFSFVYKQGFLMNMLTYTCKNERQHKIYVSLIFYAIFQHQFLEGWR